MKIIVLLLFTIVMPSAVEVQGMPPTSFELYPSEVEVKDLNAVVRFNCVPATGSAPMVYTWLKDGEVRKLNSSDGSWRFRLDKSSQGNYRCIAMNQYGALLGRNVTYHAGYFESSWSSSMRAITHDAGSVAEISLPPYKSYPSPTVQWTVDGNMITNSQYRLRHFVSLLSHKLVILDLRSDESENVYRATVRVIFSTGPVQTPPYYLSVRGSTKTTALAPQVVIAPKSVTFPYDKISKNVYFECVFNARPLANLKQLWYKRTKTSTGNTVRTLLENTLHFSLSYNNRTLKIVDVKESDAGSYDCEAHMPGLTVVRRTADLKYLRKATIVAKSPTDLTVKYGERQELKCGPDGDPKPTVRWYRNARLLGTNARMEAGVTRYGMLASGSLILKSALPSDAGVFQCFAENGIGQAMLTVWLKVQSSRPAIVEKPRDTTNVEGRTTNLTCKATGAPTPTISWYKGTSPVPLATNGQIRVDGSILYFLSPTSADSARYTCEARSVMGSARASAFLRIKKRTRITRPPPATMSVVFHDTLRIRCGFEHDPDVSVRVEWILLPSSAGSVPKNVTTGDGMSTLTDGTLVVQYVRFAGTYKCNIFSSAGNDTAQTVVTVKELPRKPTMLSAKLNALDKQAVDLKWAPGFDGHAPILEFIISKTEMKLGTASGSPTVVASVSPTVREYTVRNLLSSRTYKFCVAAKNEVGQSAHCGESQPIQTPQLPPSGPPRSVYATAPSNSTIVVQWSAPLEQHHNGPLLGYVLRYRAYKYVRQHTQNISNPSARRFLLRFLVPFTEYEIQVAAYNAKGMGKFSQPYITMTLEGRPTAAPTNVTLTAVSSTTVTASWTPLLPREVNGINQGYKINMTCLDPKSNCPNKLVLVAHKEGERTTITHSITGLRKYALYRVQIWCYTMKGNGVPSPDAEVRTKEDAPGPVSNLRFESVVDSTIDVHWAPPTSPNGILTGYVLSYRIRDSTDPKTDSFTLPPTARSKKITDLRHQTWYIVTLVAYTSKGAGIARSSSVRSGVPPKRPHAPTSLVWSNPQARSVVLQFTPGFDGNSSISLWIVEAVTPATAPDSWSVVFTKRDPGANRLTVTGLTPHTRYRIRMIAENIKGRSPPSDATDWFQTQEAAPDLAPQGLITRVTSATSMSARWRPLPSNSWNGVPIGYRVGYRQVGSSEFKSTNVLDSNANSLLLDKLRPFTEYEIKIGAYNKRGVGPWSKTVRDRTWEAVPSTGPSVVQVIRVTATSADINWTLVANASANGNLLGYRVSYQASGGVAESRSVASPDAHSLTLTGLRSFTTYRVQVAAYNRIGAGPPQPRPALDFNTASRVPSPPARLYFPLVSNTSVSVAWSEPQFPNGVLTGYQLSYRRTDPRASSALVSRSLPLDQRRFTAPNLATDAQYEFQVSAVNGQGQGAAAKAVVMTSRAGDPPDAPMNPSVLNSQSGPRHVTITWSPRSSSSAPIRNYTLEYRRYSAPIGPWMAVPETITTNQFTIRNLTPYTIYRFRVAANNDNGRSPFTNETENHRTAGDVPSAAPTIRSLEPLDRTTIAISWQKIPTIAWNEVPVGYRIFYKRWMSSARNLTADVGHSLSSASLRLLTAGWYYEIRLAAYNTEGHGPLSVPRIIYVGEAKPTAAPSEFACTNITATEIRCSWKAPSKEKSNGELLGFKIFLTDMGIRSASRRRRAAPKERMVAITSATSKASVSDLRPFHRYLVRILAFNPAGDGPNGTSIQVATKESKPGPPGPIAVTELTLQSAKLSWQPPEEPNGIITSYRVEYRQSGPEGITRRVVQTVKTVRFNARDLVENTEYFFLVSARTSVDWGPPRNVSVITGPVPGSPSAPIQLTVVQDSSSAQLRWHVEQAGVGSLVGAVIEAQKKGSSDWQLVDYLRPGTPVTYYRALFERLQPNSYYRFRVTAVSSTGISSASKPSLWVKTPDYNQGPFYKQWWFLVIVGLCGVILIIITISVLCFTGRNRRARARARARMHHKYGYDNNGASLDLPPSCLERDENGFNAFPMSRQPYGSASLYGTSRRSTGTRTPVSTLPRSGPSAAPMGAEVHSTLSRKHVKSPPRPSPASVTNMGPDDSSDEDSKHPIPSSKGSDSSGTTTRKHHPESDSDYTDEFDDDEFEKVDPPPPLSFLGTRKTVTDSSQMQTPPRWGGPGQPPSINPYSFSDSDNSTLPYQAPNRISLHQAGSRAPIPSYSSFV